MGNLLQNTIFGQNKYKPNTFIGGVGNTLNTSALIASKLGISVNRIKSFSVVGNDIQFNVTGGNYVLAGSAFYGNTDITYFNDTLGLITDCPFGNAFYLASNLNWVRLPGMIKLGYRSFCECVNLETIYFNSLLEVSSESFTNCRKLINLNNSFKTVTTLGNMCFQNCTLITDLHFPNVSLCNLNASTTMFSGMSSLVTFNAPNLTLIANGSNGHNMFFNCINLENINLTALNFIPQNFVLNCVKLKTLNLPNAVIGNLLTSFSNTPLLETLNTPNLETLITNSYRAFYQCGVKNIDFSKITNLSILSNDIFENTTGLQTIDIRSCTTSIGSSASVNNNVFRLMKTGVIITANVIQQTINSGAPEPDLAYAISNRSATVNYIE